MCNKVVAITYDSQAKRGTLADDEITGPSTADTLDVAAPDDISDPDDE